MKIGGLGTTIMSLEEREPRRGNVRRNSLDLKDIGFMTSSDCYWSRKKNVAVSPKREMRRELSK